MSAIGLLLCAVVAGWNTCRNYDRNYRTVENETLVVTNIVKTHNGTIDIGKGGVLRFVKGSKYITSEGSSEPEIVNVNDGGAFVLQGELWIYRLAMNIAPGGKAYIDPTEGGFWCGTYQRSVIENRGTFKLPSGLDFGPSSDPGCSFTIVQKAGTLILGGSLKRRVRLELAGGTLKIVGDTALVGEEVTLTGPMKIDIAKGCALDFRKVKITGGGSYQLVGAGEFINGERHPRRRAPGKFAGVAARVDYADGMQSNWRNPMCGIAHGYWTFLERGKTEVNRLQGNRTALWSLNRYSTGYHVDWDKDNEKFDKFTKPFTGPDNAPLDASALASISNSFVHCREHGGSVIPRFAYHGYWGVGVEPPDVAVITNHIRQIAEVIAPFRDIIPSVDCGIIGPWGEMHTSKYSDEKEMQYARELIVGAWLKYLPKEFPVTLRAPRYRIGVDDPDRRLGFYNDGYLGTHSDTGTWPAPTDRKWACDFMRDRPYIPYGGEFAGVEEKYAEMNPIFKPAEYNLVQEWYDTHLAYLRNCAADNETTVCRYLKRLTFTLKDFAFEGIPNLGEYEGVDLYRFCRDHMGSRFVVRDAVFKPGVIALALENTGFAGLPFKTVPSVLFVRDEKFPDAPIAVPARAATPVEGVLPTKTDRLAFRFAMPALEPGNWKVYLRIDVPPKRTLSFLNHGAWNEDIEANYLCTIKVK